VLSHWAIAFSFFFSNLRSFFRVCRAYVSVLILTQAVVDSETLTFYACLSMFSKLMLCFYVEVNVLNVNAGDHFTSRRPAQQTKTSALPAEPGSNSRTGSRSESRTAEARSRTKRDSPDWWSEATTFGGGGRQPIELITTSRLQTNTTARLTRSISLAGL